MVVEAGGVQMGRNELLAVGKEGSRHPGVVAAAYSPLIETRVLWRLIDRRWYSLRSP